MTEGQIERLIEAVNRNTHEVHAMSLNLAGLQTALTSLSANVDQLITLASANDSLQSTIDGITASVTAENAKVVAALPPAAAPAPAAEPAPAAVAAAPAEQPAHS